MGSIDMTTIEIPIVLRDRLRRGKVHRGQPYYELIEDALDFLEDAEVPRRRSLGTVD